MPAVVRGGRRQAPQAPVAKTASSKSGPKPAAKPRGGARKAAVANGKYKVIGSVHMPNELTAWLMVLIIAGLLGVILLTGHRAQALGNAFVNFTNDRLAALGLKVEAVRLSGVPIGDPAEADVKKAMHFSANQPLALMDLAAIQKDIENVGWVKSATVRRQFPGTLIISVVERPRLAVWSYNGKETVIDDQGQIIPEANALKFPDLPFIVGEGANETAPDILELVRARPELLQRTYALVRVDTRRWDIRLKNGTVIKLPALDQDQAMNKLDALISQQRVLDQGLAEIDLLDPNSLVVVPLEARPNHAVTPAPAH